MKDTKESIQAKIMSQNLKKKKQKEEKYECVGIVKRWVGCCIVVRGVPTIFFNSLYLILNSIDIMNLQHVFHAF